MRTIFFVLAAIGFGVLFCHAQTIDTDDNQSWNDVQITVPMSEQFDFTLTGTFRFGKNITRLNDRRIAVGFVYKPNKSWSLQPFYWNIVARNASSRFLTEHRLNFRATYRFTFNKFGLSHRSWIERRLRQPRNSWRFRPSLTFEKDIKKSFPTRAFSSRKKFFTILF
ncbi:MAG: DUF2490 domain-containing protein [Acidobacteriota bacterium]|nr:DUF2490 domain-containing protein [Acidobacteriota bacterium]